MFNLDWRQTVSLVAPTLGAALGGPLGGLAGRVIGQVLTGKPDASDEEVKAAVAGATPEDLLKLKQADNDFKLSIEKLGVDYEKIAADDRASARGREQAVRDWMPGILGCGVTVGFFGVLLFMMTHDIPASTREALYIMLGALGASFGAVMQYYFGSSAGSSKKSELLARRTELSEKEKDGV